MKIYVLNLIAIEVLLIENKFAGGSCGNLSRGSFETQPPRKKKGRRCRDAARASASQREGGSLQVNIYVYCPGGLTLFCYIYSLVSG